MKFYFIKYHKATTALFCAIFMALSGNAIAKTVSTPITLDYPTLNSLIANSAFTGAGQTATPLDENDACRLITLSEPEVRDKGLNTLIGMKVFTRMGTFLLGRCVMPVEWEGYLEVEQTSWIEDDWVLRFKVVDSTLFNASRKPATATSLIWNLIKTYAHAYLDTITVNLAKPVDELKALIPPMFPNDIRGRAEDLVHSMRPGNVDVSSENVSVNIMMDIDDSYTTKKEPEKPLSEQELATFIEAWESLDAFLVYQVSSIGEKLLTTDEHQELMDILIETRTEFVTELTEPSDHDFTRKQFVSAWSRLSPMLRSRFTGDTTGSILSYLSFFTASDALTLLDTAGPGLGIEISRNGLLRMARMLSEGNDVPLSYEAETSNNLRRAIGLADGPAYTGDQIPDIEEIEIDGIEDDDVLSRLLLAISPATACAKQASSIDTNEIKKWLVSKKNPQPYVSRVRTLLTSATGDVLKKSKLDKKYHEMYKRLVSSFAWQESCFRQFKVRKGKVVYLRSYNNTSVGLMQINERVWRGIYNRHSLRWDIRYNAMAGCEIIDLYIQKYALRKMKKMKKPLDDDTLARAVYAMYNGGPSQFRKFLKRHKKKNYYLSDKLIWEKYKWVKEDKWEKTNKCLVGI